MCSVCLRTPCAPSCPNAEEPKPAFICSKCGCGIFPGWKFFPTPNKGPVCKDCLDDMSTEELFAILGEELETAE